MKFIIISGVTCLGLVWTCRLFGLVSVLKWAAEYQTIALVLQLIQNVETIHYKLSVNPNKLLKIKKTGPTSPPIDGLKG